MSARTLREGGSVASAPFRTTPKGPSNRTATDEDDAPRTSFESTANSHTTFPQTTILQETQESCDEDHQSNDVDSYTQDSCDGARPRFRLLP